MVFSSLTFLFLFLPLVLSAYFIMPKPLRNTFIFISGLAFYAWGEPIYVVAMVISTLIDYCAGLFINRYDDNPKLRRLGLIVSVVMNLSLLGLFKYGGFVTDNLNALFHLDIINPVVTLGNALGLDAAKPLLPIGISFFTFQSMSYTIDLYRRNIKVQKNPVTFAAFVTLFPQIVAGPIVRYEDIAEELNERKITIDMVYEGIVVFIMGLGKKVLIANNIGLLWDSVKALPTSELSVMSAWLGILAFTFQIYFDFSGYSDMAIGLGKILGFHFPENFDYPYLSRSVSEFWRRWHMTLGAWFRSYVYIPLGGSRKGKLKIGDTTLRTIFNLAVVWLLTGIWHGASWNFILWGCFYGVIIITEKLFLGKVLAKLPALVSTAYTMFFVVIGWVLFSLPDLPSAWSFLGTMFGANGSGVFMDKQAVYLLANYWLMFVICIFASSDIFKQGFEWLEKHVPIAVRWGAVPVTLAIFTGSVAYLVNQGYNPFLYFNF